jgi:hypothetical protein
MVFSVHPTGKFTGMLHFCHHLMWCAGYNERNEGDRMPIGPRGERRPADVIGAAIAVAKIATGEIVEASVEKSGRVRSRHAGATARARNLTKEKRSQIGKKAAAERWGRK